MTTDRSGRRSALRSIAAAALAFGFLLAGAGPATADYDDQIARYERELQERERERQRNAEQREQLESELEGTRADLAETYLALQDANDRLPIAEAELAEAEAELAAAERAQQAVADRLVVAETELEGLAESLAEGGARIEATRSSIGELARTTYRGGSSLSTLSVVLNATSSEEFIKQSAIVDTAVRHQTQVITDLENITAVNRNRELRQDAVRDRVAELLVEAENAVAAADDARAESAARTEEIRRIRDEQTALAAQLEDAKEQLDADLAQKQADDDRLAGIIAGIESDRDDSVAARERQRERERERERERQREREQQAARDNDRGSGSSGGSSGGGSSGGSGGGGGGGSTGAMIPPVPNPLYVTSAYGYRIHPLAGYRWWHAGVDIRSACGNPQVAAASGTINATRPARGNGSHGNQVIMDHGTMNGSGYVTVYNHLTRFAVRAGQYVNKGDVIGYTGATGNVTGCHVHFEVWKNGSTIDPMGLPGFRRTN